MTTRDDAALPFFMTPSEIYRQLTEGPGTRALVEEQRYADLESSAENERAELITSLANTVKSGWQGEASAGAYGAAMPLAERAFENAAKLDRSQDLLSRQADSFNTAVNSVRPVSDPPESSIDEPFPFEVDYEKSVKDYQDGAQHNIAVFSVYDGASSYNETNTPQEFSNETRSGGNVSVKGATDTIPVEETGPGATDEPRNGGGTEGSGSPSDTSSFRAPWTTSGDLADEDGFQTSPNDFRSSPAPLSTYPLPSPSNPVTGQPVSATTGGFVGSAPVGGFSGSGGGGSGPRVAGGGGAGSVRNLGPGMGAGAVAAEEAAARRAAQAAARPGGAGPMGAPMGGAGRGKDDEDTEHQRKVLIETDAEAVFGSDVLTAPQVIGEDEYED